MFILALESTTEACSVALLQDDIITEQFEIAPRQHTNLLLNMIDNLLSEQRVMKRDLDAIAFCRGPGAFTGLRITAGVAQGLAFGLNIPVIAISSLAALAQGAYRDTQSQQTTYLSCLDARKGEVFWGRYLIEAGFAKCVDAEYVSSVEDISHSGQNNLDKKTQWQVIGTGRYIVEKLNEPQLIFADLIPDTVHYPHAYDIAVLAAREYELGNTVTAEMAIPVYLRNNVTY